MVALETTFLIIKHANEMHLSDYDLTVCIDQLAYKGMLTQSKRQIQAGLKIQILWYHNCHKEISRQRSSSAGQTWPLLS